MQEDQVQHTNNQVQRHCKGIWIPIEIWNDPDLNLTQKALWAELHALNGPDGCFASNAYLAKFMGIDERNIRAAIAVLKEKGLVYQESFDGRTRVLRTLYPQPPGNIPTPPKKSLDIDIEHPVRPDENIRARGMKTSAPPSPPYKERYKEEASSAQVHASAKSQENFSEDELEEIEKVLEKRKRDGKPDPYNPSAFNRKIVEDYRQRAVGEQAVAKKAEERDELIARRRSVAETWKLCNFEDGIKIRVSDMHVEVCNKSGCCPYQYDIPKNDWNNLLAFLQSKYIGPKLISA